MTQYLCMPGNAYLVGQASETRRLRVVSPGWSVAVVWHATTLQNAGPEMSLFTHGGMSASTSQSLVTVLCHRTVHLLQVVCIVLRRHCEYPRRRMEFRVTHARRCGFTTGTNGIRASLPALKPHADLPWASLSYSIRRAFFNLVFA